MLSQTVRKKEINNKEFQIYMLDGITGALMAKKLAALVASFLSSNSEDGTIELDFSNIAEAVSGGLSDSEFIDMINKLLNGAAVDGQELNPKTYFSANYGEMIQAISFALQENFSSFFEGMGIIE